MIQYEIGLNLQKRRLGGWKTEEANKERKHHSEHMPLVCEGMLCN